MEEQLRTEALHAADAWRNLDTALRKLHGKKRDKWPPEAEQELAAALETARRAAFERLFLATPQKELDDSAGDVRKRLQPASLADDPNAAVWVVTTAGRYSYGARPTWWCSVLEVTPGGTADSSRALAALIEHHETANDRAPATLAGFEALSYRGSYRAPSVEEPQLQVSVCGQGMRWKAAAGAMEELLEDLAELYTEQSADASR